MNNLNNHHEFENDIVDEYNKLLKIKPIVEHFEVESFIKINTNECFEKLNDLKFSLSELFKEYAGEEFANEISTDIIWNENCFENLILFHSAKLKKKAIKAFANIIYKISFGCINGRPFNFTSETDYYITLKILNNKKIINTIIFMGNLIFDFFYKCKIVAFELGNTFGNCYSQESIWYFTKFLVKRSTIKNYRIVLEDNLSYNNYYFEKILNNNLFIKNFERMIYYYSNNINIKNEINKMESI
ncbi:MAG: hypothetical protein JW924_05125 [Fusobacteriaceae bacterium]|nr:hypothetical protein [Fusobacteriaceae bacterium]